MRRFPILSMAIVVLGLTSCHQKDLENKQVTIDSLQAVVLERDAEIDSLFVMFNEIENNLSLINSKYSAVQEMRRNTTEGGVTQKQAIADHMASIESIMADNKKKIAQLNRHVSEGKSKNEELLAFITRLEERSTQQEQQIAQLTYELENSKLVIANLHHDVNQLTASNKEKDDYIARQLADANRAWFIVGSYDELKESGIVNKTGGFIGIGRKLGTVADMNTELFTLIDRSKVTTITIDRKKAKVVSQHPEDSYELVTDEDDPSITAYLRILNPSQFWKYTDYLVISSK